MACRFDILDRPDGRKMHSEATPLLGGAAIFTAILAAVLLNGIFNYQIGAMLFAATILFAVGIIDDIREIPAAIKLASQSLCAVVVIISGTVLRVFPDYFGAFSQACNSILTFFWLLGITNAMNFFDGMDGMAAGLGAVISFFLGVVAFQTQNAFAGWISVAMMGGCIGFLPYNILRKKRATIFLGDAGSTVLGFLLACVAVYGEWRAGDPVVAMASPLLIFWVLIFDMVHITVERVRTGKIGNFRQWIEYTGRDHLHHRIAHVLGGQKRSVLFIYLMNVCLGTSAVVLLRARRIDALLLLGQAAIMVVLITILERRGGNLAAVVEGKPNGVV